MRCLTLSVLLAFSFGANAHPVKNGGQPSMPNWRELSKVNEPPNKPSYLAAKAATQGMTKQQIKAKHMRFVLLYREASAKASGTTLQILKREIQLLALAGG